MRSSRVASTFFPSCSFFFASSFPLLPPRLPLKAHLRSSSSFHCRSLSKSRKSSSLCRQSRNRSRSQLEHQNGMWLEGGEVLEGEVLGYVSFNLMESKLWGTYLYVERKLIRSRFSSRFGFRFRSSFASSRLLHAETANKPPPTSTANTKPT